MRISQFNQILAVDGYPRDADRLFLSHVHRDHMPFDWDCWIDKPVVMSRTSARIVEVLSGRRIPQLQVLDPGESIPLPGDSVKVTAYDANHCPGAVMFLFEDRNHRLLYTGDFRINDEIRRLVRGPLHAVDVVYADQTFRDAKIVFPPQKEAIRRVIEIIRSHPDQLIILMVYTIGKNRIIDEIFRHTGSPVFVSPAKARIYQAAGLHASVTTDRNETPIRAYSRAYLVRNARHFPPGTVTIMPTGWQGDIKTTSSLAPGPFYWIPYSEHCSPAELEEFFELLQAREVHDLELDLYRS